MEIEQFDTINVLRRRLYRAVSTEEWADISAKNAFAPGPNSLLGKWFAEKEDHARRWGDLLYQGKTYHVIQVEIPSDVADQMFRLPVLDQIGPARYADGDILDLLNRTCQGICEVPEITMGDS